MTTARERDRLRVLIVEDDPLDAELVADELRNDRLAFEERVVSDEADFRAALASFAPDIVLSDVALPGFSGHRALDILREHCTATPFIFISGTIGEEAAVEALRRGATDYVIKGRLARLASAVRRALREADEARARARVENELMRAQRFESLAMLAGGFSHDLRNILQPLLLTAEVISTHEDAELRKHGQLVGDCTRRGLEMVASMLSFARGARVNIERVRLSVLFDALDLLLRGSVPRNVDLVFEKDGAEDIVFEGNHTELQQCLLNLCLNALQAMPEGGTLKLSAAPFAITENFEVEGGVATPGPYIRIAVTDSGIGMPEEVRANLFRPFFTTKDSGTGLGLISCKRIVGNHGGFLRVQSEAGRGTTFEIYMPVPSNDTTEGETAFASSGRGEQVLIVAERAGKLNMLYDSLSLNGYAATMAQNAPEALQWIQAHGVPDLLVMDSDMSLMNGVRTLVALLDIDYAGPVIMLEHPAKPVDREGLPPIERIRFVDKPVSQPLLLRAVREELDASAAARKR